MVLKKNWLSADSIITLTLFITISIFLIFFSQHSIFAQPNLLTQNNDTILDKFDESNQDKIEQKPYFLRIHRIFSFAFVSIGIGIIFLSTQTGGHISVDEGLGLTFLGFVIIGFAALLWKFPKIMSWFVALFYLGIFLIAEFILVSEDFIDPLHGIGLLKTFSLLLFLFSFLILAFIVVSKTAREEWKMT